MSNQPAAPVEAGSLAPWAQAIAHARIPDALKLLLLALLAAFGAAETARHRRHLPRQDWFITANSPAGEESPLTWNELRRLRRARAELGWLLRGKPNRGMRLSGHPAPELRPARSARAPPRPAYARTHPGSAAKTPRPAATTHARITPWKPARSAAPRPRSCAR